MSKKLTETHTRKTREKAKMTEPVVPRRVRHVVADLLERHVEGVRREQRVGRAVLDRLGEDGALDMRLVGDGLDDQVATAHALGDGKPDGDLREGLLGALADAVVVVTRRGAAVVHLEQAVCGARAKVSDCGESAWARRLSVA